jgi:lipoate-protein ligase A
MIDYRIASHPTMYKGVIFRSRLEARWAAFFDLLEWQWEYEPFDLVGWTPDFLIIGKEQNALVEINQSQTQTVMWRQK